MAVDTSNETLADLERRLGSLYDLTGLAKFCRVSRRGLRLALEEAGVPLIRVGRKELVVKEHADRALGLREAAVALDSLRDEEAMDRREYRPDGTRKTVQEFAAESDARVAAFLAATPAKRGRPAS
jgi:hypothetical protein